jgi:hypothetical protein
MTAEQYKRAVTLTNLIHSLAIVQEGYIMEVEQIFKNAGQFRYAFKRHVGEIRRNAEILRKAINTNDPKHAESFGDDSETIEDTIKTLLNSKNIEV